MNAVTMFLMTLFNRLRSKTPIDTGNMLAHIVYAQQSKDLANISISAPMSSRAGLKSRRTGESVSQSSKDYDYSKDVNYSSKSPHQFWVEHQIKYSVHIVKSNFNYGLYK
jgi:hypothetical protein